MSRRAEGITSCPFCVGILFLLCCQQPGTLGFHAIQIVVGDLSVRATPPGFRSDEFKRDRPAAADVTASENFFQARKAKLLGGYLLNRIPVVKCVVGMQAGE